jgi:hypothetical protein
MRSRTARVCSYSLGLFLMVSGFGRNVLATNFFPVPEIDSASISAGLGVLVGGILILRSRRHSK